MPALCWFRVPRILQLLAEERFFTPGGFVLRNAGQKLIRVLFGILSLPFGPEALRGHGAAWASQHGGQGVGNKVIGMSADALPPVPSTSYHQKFRAPLRRQPADSICHGAYFDYSFGNKI
jgi:hypothetical protein